MQKIKVHPRSAFPPSVKRSFRPYLTPLQEGKTIEVPAEEHETPQQLRRTLIASLGRWVSAHNKIATRIRGRSVFLRLENIE